MTGPDINDPQIPLYSITKYGAPPPITDFVIGTHNGINVQFQLTYLAATIGTPFITPQQYNAKGNGIANDTVALQSAMNVAALANLPLLMVGNFTYLVDNLSIPSNLHIIGDNSSTIKLLSNATGAVFAWPLNATTTNVSIDGINIDGNYAGQSGAPHNLTHSIFFGNNTTTITASRFRNLIVTNIDGECFSFRSIFTDCEFSNIRITNHSQDAFAITATRCHFSQIYIFNATNTGIRNTCNGFSMDAATSCTFNVITVQLSTHDIGTDKVGFLINNSATDNLLNAIDIDCGGGANNFSYSIDTGSNNQCTNLIARNGIYNCDYELFNQTGLQITNIFSNNPGANCVGIIADGVNHGTINNYVYYGTSQGTDAIRVGGFVYGGCNDFEINGYSITGASEGIRMGFAISSNLRFFNGGMTNLSNSNGNCGIFMDGTAEVDDVIIDGLVINGVEIPWTFNRLIHATISNIIVVAAISPYVQTACSDINYVNVIGVNSSVNAISVAGAITAGTALNVNTAFTVDINGSTVGKDLVLNTGASNAAKLMKDGNYNTLSLNGAVAFPNALGISGGAGGDSELYYYGQSGHHFYSTSTEVASISSIGQLAVLKATAPPAAGSTSARLVMGSTAGFGVYFGSGAPTVSAAKGSLYLRTDGTTTNNRMYVNTDGSTTWTAVTTVA